MSAEYEAAVEIRAGLEVLSREIGDVISAAMPSYRDLVAGQVLAAIVGCPHDLVPGPAEAARIAFDYADALFEELKTR